MEITTNKLRELRAVAKHPVSLDQKVGENNSSELGDLVADNAGSEYMLARVANFEQSRLINSLLREIPDRERELICRRFGFHGFEQHTLAECGDAMNVSHERARQIEIAAMKRLRRLAIKSNLSTHDALAL